MKKIKLAIVFPQPFYPAGGGCETSLCAILESINQELFDIILIVKFPLIHESYLSRIPQWVKIEYLLPKKYINYTENSYSYKFPEFIYKPLTKYIASKNLVKLIDDSYDVVLDYEPFLFTQVLLQSKKIYSGKVIGWHHSNANVIKKYLAKFTKRYPVKFVDVVDSLLFVNKFTTNEMKEYFVGSKLSEHVHTIYNGMLFNDMLTKSKQEVEEKYKELLASKYILMVARLDAPKDHETLIKAFAKIKKQYPEYQLVFCGAGSKLNELLILCKTLNVEQFVHFLGGVANPYVWMKNAQMVVLSSFYEGLPMVVTEAMYFNKPLIVSNIQPCMEAIDNANCGFSFLVGDVDSLIVQIEKVISKNYDEKELIQNQNKFINQFDIRNTVKELEQILS